MFFKKKSIALIGIFFVVMLSIVMLRNWSSSTQDSFILGTMSGWPPYVTINDQGVYEGLDIDVAQELARRMGKKLVIKDMETAALICGLEQGTVDIILTGLDITPARLQKIAMIAYQGDAISSFPLVFWKTVPADVTTLTELFLHYPQATVCVEPGSSQEPLLNQFDQGNIKRIDPLLAVLELKYGKAMAVLMGPTLYQDFKKKYPELVAIECAIDEMNQTFGCGIGIKKDNTELIKKIEFLIKELKENGFMAALETKWFKESQ